MHAYLTAGHVKGLGFIGGGGGSSFSTSSVKK